MTQAEADTAFAAAIAPVKDIVDSNISAALDQIDTREGTVYDFFGSYLDNCHDTADEKGGFDMNDHSNIDWLFSEALKAAGYSIPSLTDI